MGGLFVILFTACLIGAHLAEKEHKYWESVRLEYAGRPHYAFSMNRAARLSSVWGEVEGWLGLGSIITLVLVGILANIPD